ncbi:Pre-mRNA-splicing factor [Conoideocrella luteorostrata]|uniref:Pre-mRNA-splicing factor CWC2 n=1 Tax=Conoideocrella luteorostrata TaxID=1105319 RepID=A0AAJ0CNR6_9HYPO|nr:Pre-mRNA-splicing factor [Conoideocrella luteorostrata]
MSDHDDQSPTVLAPEGDAAEPMAVATTEKKTTVKKIIRKKKRLAKDEPPALLRRPARVQMDPSEFTSEPPPQIGTTFNIWYNKWAGGDREAQQQTKAKGRCNIATDSGFTTSDSGSYFCLRFARGICPLGRDCMSMHRLPGMFDLFNPNVDCFGREKFSDYRDDMGGVGSFMRQNRTIYVGRIHVSEDIEEIVARHFAEWGQVERIRVLRDKGVGFITYTNEANAQFAREAMAHQSLDHDEILNVRWATADPNPMAKAREARLVEEQAAEAVRRALPAEFVAEIEGKDPEARKRRRIESGYGLDGYEAPDNVHFARGRNAVNPVGRDGFEVEYQERLMIEDGQPASEALEITTTTAQAAAPGKAGIFSGSTLAALSKAKVSVSSKPKAAASTGPLVSYDSDSDDE